MTMEITVTNPDGTTAGFSLLYYQIDKYFDKSGTCELTLNPSTTIQENSILEATFRGTIRFRGYIDFPEINDDQTVRVVAYEQQRLLEFRYTQVYEYPAGTTLEKMITADEPTTCIGLLYMANSLIPQGAFKVYSGNVYYIRDYLDRGGGTSSKFGTVTKVYANTTLLTKGTSPSLSAGQWWQDDNEFYIRMPDDRNPKYWLVSIPNWKETLLRLSPNSTVSNTITVPYRVGRTQIVSEIDRMCLAFGKEYQWQHNNDGYTYLYINETVGRGNSISGIANFRENDTIYVYTEEQTGDPRIDGLIGAGSGSGVTQEVYSLLNLYGTGVWKEDVYTDSHQFEEQLENTLALVFPDKIDPFSYTIITDEDPAMNPGDWVNVIKVNAMPVSRRIKKTTYTSESEMTINLGQRLLDISDVTQSKFEVLGSYNDFVNSYASSWTFSFNNDSITDSVPFEETFKIETDELDTEYPYRFMLNVNVGWYKETKGEVDTAAHSHSGSTGGGGSHAHTGDTETGGEHDHDADGTTEGYVGYEWNCITDIDSGGYHDHDITIGYDTHNHDATYTNDDVWKYTEEASGHDHEFLDYYCAGVWTESDSHAHGAESDYGGAHEHSTDSAWVAGEHSHYLPPSKTTTMPADSRGIYTQDVHTNPMITEILTPTMQDNFARLLSTGNSIHYLTLTIKINGSNVDGSPFSNYYPGDSISDIDITSLVTTGSKNTIWIGISEYGGSDPVRCSISGSVNSKYFITTL